ncbi:MAG: 30S ribosomal protein S7, partial [Proteobacteria bacterium]|nr:30S ribosomal protein S7 [Pseudomonadota bacterium]
MSRKRSNFKREVLPDPKHGSELISKYINMVMKSGKKAVAENIVYGAMEQVAEKEKGDIVEITERALEKVKPMVEV